MSDTEVLFLHCGMAARPNAVCILGFFVSISSWPNLSRLFVGPLYHKKSFNNFLFAYDMSQHDTNDIIIMYSIPNRTVQPCGFGEVCRLRNDHRHTLRQRTHNTGADAPRGSTTPPTVKGSPIASLQT